MEKKEIISILLAITSFLLILIVGLRSDLLKESNQPGKPYSFHKFQLWVWTLIICPAFSLHWGFNTPDTAMINETALVLLGISSATAVVAEMISSSQKNDARNLTLKAALPTTGFWADILKDDSGQISIGRLQQLIFTFVYVAIYLYAFFPNMEYPVFDKEAYMLMGISTGTYLLGKGFNK
jgi:hypothetical protein